MKIVIITTEASGDYLGYNILKLLKKKKRKIEVLGVGGELMESMNFKSWISLKNFDAIGIYEVFSRILKFYKIFKFIEEKIRRCNPDIVLTIDSPSFNYRLIKNLQDIRNNTKFIHYVAPTVWAWKSYRARIFAKLYDLMFTLFKFETKYFSKYGLKTVFIGHQIFFKKEKRKTKMKKICFLPGSRTQEIQNNLKILKTIVKESSEKYKHFDFYILTFKDNGLKVKEMLGGMKIKIITDFKKKQKILSESFLAIAASGSVTLELTKYLTPMIVVYNTHFFTRIIIKLFVRVKFATILNIFFDREIIPELIFEKFTKKNVMKKIDDLINNNKEREKQIYYLKKFSDKMIIKNKNPSEILLKYILKIN